MRDVVAGLRAKIGDATTLEMNSAHFEAPSIALDALISAAQAHPFLAERRLVTVKNVSKVISGDGKDRFTTFLDQVPESTGLVLMEIVPQTREDKNKWERHWLLKWAKNAGHRALVRDFILPKGPITAWIQQKAKDLGGEIKQQAANELAKLVGTEKDAAVRELEKLMAYVGYSRPIELTDVEDLSMTSGEHGDFFALVDALSAGHSSNAMALLKQLMEERDLIALFFSLVAHFRLLLQAREIVDSGRGDVDIAKVLGVHPYRAEKLAAQARHFTMATLKEIYLRLVEFDEQIKTGKMDPDLAMEIFVASLSAQPA
jgi:DNA polymerase-3 subunit delta